MPGTYLLTNDAELWLGDLCLTDDTITPGGERFTIKAQADELVWGSPAPVTQSVQRWGNDGAVTSITGWSNRVSSFKVYLYGDDSDNLAAAERELVKAARTATTLRWIPPEGPLNAAASVFDVQTVTVDPIPSRDDEMRLARLWQVTIEAWPWVHPDQVTILAALPANPSSPDLLEVDACASSSGWTGTPNTPTATGGSIHESITVTGGGVRSLHTLTLTRSGSVSGMTTTPYLMTDVTLTGAGSYTVWADGVPLVAAAVIGSVTYWHMPAGVDAFTTLLIAATFSVGPNASGTRAVTAHDISRTDTIGGVGTRRQLMRTLHVGGAVPTMASFQVASPDTTPLGTVLLHSRVADGSGFTPPLRQWRTSGGPLTTDATAVSGQKDKILTGGVPGALMLWTIPAPLLNRTATYAVVGRFSCSNTTTTLTVTLSAAPVGGLLSAFAQTVGSMTFPTANSWQVIPLGTMTLPPAAVPDNSTVGTILEMVATSATGTGDVYLDEVWLLDKSTGEVTIVACGTTAGTATRLWYDAPDADPGRNLPAIYVGTQDDRSDAVAVPMGQIISLGQHRIDPDDSTLFSVTDNVADAVVSGQAYRRGHTQLGNIA